jgi:hypothetical protein
LSGAQVKAKLLESRNHGADKYNSRNGILIFFFVDYFRPILVNINIWKLKSANILIVQVGSNGKDDKSLKKNGNTCLEEQQNDVQFPVPASYVITYIH